MSEIANYTYSRIFGDADGKSHFADVTVPFQEMDYAPPIAPIGVSSPTPAEAVLFLSVPPGYVAEWHPAPAKQLIIFLSGVLETEVSDGERRRFKGGDAVLLEDVAGEGHSARVVSEQRVVMAAIPVESGDDK